MSPWVTLGSGRALAESSFSLLSLLISLLLLCTKHTTASTALQPNLQQEEERIYFLKRLSGGGCPYTASWLAHVNLYRKLPWWIDITKMEAASFTIFDRAQWKFQLSDPDAYFVHHMSMFEHLNHKKSGFAVAQNKTIALSQAAFEGECGSLVVSRTKQYIAFVPFYGGLPPGVTKELSVKSIGQGNSLVDGSTKGLQAMATVCSCLRYFGHVIIGVARPEDLIIINQLLSEKMSSAVRRSVNVVMFRMNKPANLPFHMLAWGQRYIRLHNCKQFYRKATADASTIASGGDSNHIAISGGSGSSSRGGADGEMKTKKKEKVRVHRGSRSLADSSSSNTAEAGNDTSNTTTEALAPSIAASVLEERHQQQQQQQQQQQLLAAAYSINWDDPNFDSDAIDTSLIPLGDERYDICQQDAIMKSHGGPINVTYVKKNLMATPGSGHHHHNYQQQRIAAATSSSSSGSNRDSSGRERSGQQQQQQRQQRERQLRQLLAGSSPTPEEALRRRLITATTDASASNINSASSSSTGSSSGSTSSNIGSSHGRVFVPIEYAYYTECDQVLRFDSEQTLRALTAASNATTFFSGRRKEKSRDSEAVDYMGSLSQWRECGAHGYSITWPRDRFVRID